nr:MAG TPA: hypothetical protein [Caudoviricetes sp.]
MSAVKISQVHGKDLNLKDIRFRSSCLASPKLQNGSVLICVGNVFMKCKIL